MGHVNRQYHARSFIDRNGARRQVRDDGAFVRNLPMDKEQVSTVSMKHDESIRDAEASLVDIHRRVLGHLFPTLPAATETPRTLGNDTKIPLASLEQRLKTLKRRRLALVSEIERTSSSVTTVRDELMHERNEVTHRDGGSQHTGAAVDNTDNPTSSANLATRMQEIRKERRTSGAHRICGISIVPCKDDDIVGIRLDICIHGRYVKRHYVFFSLRDDEFKLVQHTVPLGILEKLQESDKSTKLESLDDVRRYVGHVYDACCCHAVRQDASSMLRNSIAYGVSISSFKCTNSLKSMSFRLVCGDELDWTVQLEYANILSALPTGVSISQSISKSPTANRAPGGNATVGVVMDEDGNDTMELARNAFAQQSLREALGTVVELAKTRTNE